MNDSTAAAPVTGLKIATHAYKEKIGDSEWFLEEVRLDVEDVALWSDNPRLQNVLTVGVTSEIELEEALRKTSGYDVLRRSIDEIGQMEPIYVWRSDDSSKYVVLEGATRVCILRELNRKYSSGPKVGKFRFVKAKVLPRHFGEIERTILLARIHVRGTGVRAWGRYIEAKFIYNIIEDRDGRPAIMNATELANHMGKSVSWVTRLREAYKFARKFVEYVDDEEAERKAAEHFSTLEEISKAPVIGAQLRDYNNSTYDTLRSEVFEMTNNDVFKEYRDARFLKDFHDDPEKWSQLKSGERHIASKLAMEVKTNASGIKAKLSTLEQQIQRAIDHQDVEFSDDDIELLQRSIGRIHDQIHPGVRPFRIALKNSTRALSDASMSDVKALALEDLSEFREAVDYFNDLVSKHGKAG